MAPRASLTASKCWKASRDAPQAGQMLRLDVVRVTRRGG